MSPFRVIVLFALILYFFLAEIGRILYANNQNHKAMLVFRLNSLPMVIVLLAYIIRFDELIDNWFLEE